jgi:hypothetical protein
MARVLVARALDPCGVSRKDGLMSGDEATRDMTSDVSPTSTVRVLVEIEGLVAVHAVRAAATALASVPAIRSAQLSMLGAELTVATPVDAPRLHAEIAAALAVVDLGVRSLAVDRTRALPILP